VVWYFPSCQNCSIKRTRWAHPAYTMISAPRRRPARGAGMLRIGLIRRYHIFGLLHPSHHADKR
jgi:hypothetical protein